MTKKLKYKPYNILMDILYSIGSDKELDKAVESIKLYARADNKTGDKVIKHLIRNALYGLDAIDADIEKEEAEKAAKSESIIRH